MYYGSDINEMEYIQIMQCIKLQNREIKRLEKSNGARINKILNVVKTMEVSKIKKYALNQIRQKKVTRKFAEVAAHNDSQITSNYFSSKKIAIYTCIIGAYDKISEPLICPNNCDFYIVTDQDIPTKSMWKKIDFDRHSQKLVKLSDVEVNRFFKMHPDILFPDYEYSIYIDGNIQPISDLTEFINRIGDCGIAAHRHCFRNCIYKEAEVLAYLKKDDPTRIKKHVEYLKKSGMPEEYGMIECNVIARKHHNSICKTVMELWWSEFRDYSKRDQISFMHALYTNGVTAEDVATLGNNVFENDAIRKIGHV